MSVSITFTQTSGGSAAETITAAIIYGTSFSFRRLNHFEMRTADGGTVTYDAGPTEVTGVIRMKDVSAAHGDGLRDWIENDIVFTSETFKIEGTDANGGIPNVNLGLGFGYEISTTGGATEDAYFNGGQNLEGVFEYVAPGKYNIALPYRFIK